VLAAGGGTRFGDSPKLLADLGGRPLLEWSVRAQCAVPELSRVVVVLGAHAAEVSAHVAFGRAETVVCPDWASGQAASLRRGLAALSGVWKVIVTLGDAPLVTPAVIARFAGEPARTRATYGGRPGHPVVLGREQIAGLMSLSGDRGDRGARDLLRGGPVIEVGHLCSGRDVDTPDDLEEIRDEARAVI
jgi:CTP:molybdopterin cytidylyltransferase MocA